MKSSLVAKEDIQFTFIARANGASNGYIEISHIVFVWGGINAFDCGNGDNFIMLR
jgi:hypothetical protein